jgi:cytochrome c
VIPGTTMAFAGIPDPQKRADLIAYIKANGQI